MPHAAPAACADSVSCHTVCGLSSPQRSRGDRAEVAPAAGGRRASVVVGEVVGEERRQPCAAPPARPASMSRAGPPPSPGAGQQIPRQPGRLARRAGAAPGSSAPGLGKRRARRGQRQARAPERGEDRVRRARAGGDRPRLEEDGCRERRHLDALGAQRGFTAASTARSAPPYRRFQKTAPAAASVTSSAQDAGGPAGAQHEGRTALARRRSLERCKALMQPPPRGTAERRGCRATPRRARRPR